MFVPLWKVSLFGPMAKKCLNYFHEDIKCQCGIFAAIYSGKMTAEAIEILLRKCSRIKSMLTVEPFIFH